MTVNGVPLLIGLWQRLQKCREISKTVVLIPYDDPIDLPNEIETFRGPEHDVVGRFALACYEHRCLGFVRVCADSPFLPPQLVDLAAEGARNNPYVFVSGGRSGLQCEGFRTEDFLKAEPYITEREHVGLFFREGRGLAIDTPEDYERLKDIPL